MKNRLAIYVIFMLLLMPMTVRGVRAHDSIAAPETVRGVQDGRSPAKNGEAAPAWSNILTVQVGTDIGGAIPVPFSYIPDVFVPTPKVLPNVGVRYGIVLPKGWSLGAEVNYKHVEMAADAIVLNMRASLPGMGADGADMVQYFSGRASMDMAFDIMEVPVYVRYRFNGRGGHNILFGGYGAWVISSRFTNDPVNGFIGSDPNEVDMIVTPEAQIPADQKDFSRYMSKWDAGLLVGYENSFFKRIRVGLQYQLLIQNMLIQIHVPVGSAEHVGCAELR